MIFIVFLLLVVSQQQRGSSNAQIIDDEDFLKWNHIPEARMTVVSIEPELNTSGVYVMYISIT